MLQLLRKIFGQPKLSSKVVQQYYEEWNENYLQNFGDIFQSYATAKPGELIDYIASSAGIKNGDVILDAGCGICGPAVLMAEKFPASKITGITISPSQTGMAEKKIAEKQLSERIKVLTADFHEVDKNFAAGQFDVVLFLESLVHSHDPQAALAACKNVLCEGGTLYIKDLFRHYDVTIQNEIDYAVASVEQLIKMNVQDVKAVEQILLKQNFEIEFVRPLQIAPDFTNGNRFMANNHFRIFKNRNEEYNGNEFQYLMYYEIKARKKSMH